MAAIKLPVGFPLPGNITGSPAQTSHAATTSGTGSARIFAVCIPDQDISITRVGIEVISITGTSPTYEVSLQSVDGSGNPSGTILGGGTAKNTGTFSSAGWKELALDSAVILARGQVIALAIKYSSGTINSTNFVSFCVAASNTSQPGFPFYSTLASGAWTKNTTLNIIAAAIGSSTDWYGYPIEKFQDSSASSSGLRSALRFKLLSTWFGAGTFKVAGIRFKTMGPGATKNFKVGLWSASSLLQSVDVDSDHNSSPSTAGRLLEHYFTDADLIALSTDTEYYAGWQYTDAALTLHTAVVDNSNKLPALDCGAEFYLAEYNGSVWSAIQTRRPFLELVISDFTAAPIAVFSGMSIPVHSLSSPSPY